MAQQGHSEACCSVPPAVVKDYKEKGKFIEVNGMKTYTTGPSDATKGVFIIFDIFGFFPQTLQGADILAYAGNQKYQVFMPDFFNGKPASKEWYPPDNDEKGKKLGAFFAGPANPDDNTKKVPKIMEAIDGLKTGVKTWGILGMCWGGKIVSKSCQDHSLFAAAAEVHPAMIDPNEAKGIKIPLCMLASGDESAEDVQKFKDNLTVPNHVETFSDQLHGWLAARAELEKPRVKEEYERGYKVLLEFYNEHLQSGVRVSSKL